MIFFIDQWEPLKKEIEIARVKENQVKAFRSAQTAFWRGKVFCLFRARLIFQNQAIYTFINPVWLLFFRKLMQALISNDVTWLDPNLDRILPNYVYSQNHGWSFKPSENGLTNVKLLVLFASSDGAPFDFKAPQGGGRLFKLWLLSTTMYNATFHPTQDFRFPEMWATRETKCDNFRQMWKPCH